MASKVARTKSRPTVKTIPLTQARAHLGALIKRVRLNKECFILEKDGIPVAGLMDIHDFEDYLELHDPKARADIRKSYQDYLAGKGRPAEEFLAELRQEAERKSRRHRSA